MTLADLLIALDAAPADLPVQIDTPEGALGPGYHLTEVTLADIRSLDCGGTARAWRELGLHIFDGQTGRAMTTARLRAILAQARQQLGDITDLPLHAEAAPGNARIIRFALGAPQTTKTAFTLPLSHTQTRCKALDPVAGPINVKAPTCCA